MAEEKFVFDSLQDCKTIRDFLASLTEGFDKKSITLSTNGDTIDLVPEGLLAFTVKARKKGISNKLSIKIAWKDCEGSQKGECSNLKVS